MRCPRLGLRLCVCAALCLDGDTLLALTSSLYVPPTSTIRFLNSQASASFLRRTITQSVGFSKCGWGKFGSCRNFSKIEKLARIFGSVFTCFRINFLCDLFSANVLIRILGLYIFVSRVAKIFAQP